MLKMRMKINLLILEAATTIYDNFLLMITTSIVSEGGKAYEIFRNHFGSIPYLVFHVFLS